MGRMLKRPAKDHKLILRLQEKIRGLDDLSIWCYAAATGYVTSRKYLCGRYKLINIGLEPITSAPYGAVMSLRREYEKLCKKTNRKPKMFRD